jgi:lipopolysaccharide export system protein LptA
MLSLRRAVLILLLLPISLQLFAQRHQTKDSLVRLLEANSAQLIEQDGVVYRKISGPARFFHNNTYLLCDTAIWNVNTNIIDAIGNVQIIQQDTYLVGDKLEYTIAENLARFRGKEVRLYDKKNNILKTKNLDYNTKDSVAVFFEGGALKNGKNNLIESDDGRYDSKGKIFSFYNNVEMFADSIFAKSDLIDYRTDLNKAFFGKNTIAWQKANMLKTDAGSYDRNTELLEFNLNSYLFTEQQEVWGDIIKYDRKTGNADLYNNVQITDTVQSVILFADKVKYNRDPMRAELTIKPSIAMYSFEEGKADTLFVAADTMKYYLIPYSELDSISIKVAKERRSLTEIDPLIEMQKANEKAIAAKREEAAAKNNKSLGNRVAGKHPVLAKSVEDKSLEENKQINANIQKESTSLKVPSLQKDSLSQKVPALQKDSLSQKVPSLQKGSLSQKVPALQKETLTGGAGGRDTTKVTFVDAWHKVKMFRSDTQGLCDSLVYTGIDSIARFYVNPILWNETKNQFTADSIYVIVKDDSLSKADLISNAFIVSQEDSVHFNQVKSTEMMAYFRNNDIYRYDALGGASAIFYFAEDSVITLMNQKESRLLSALIKERKVQKIRYYEELKSDVLPIYKLPIEKQRLRGFSWQEDLRPKSRYDISERAVRSSIRDSVSSESTPTYPQSKIYFPIMRDSIMAYKAKLNVPYMHKNVKKKAKIKEIDAEKGDKAGIVNPESPTAILPTNSRKR